MKKTEYIRAKNKDKGNKVYLWRNPRLGTILHMGWPFKRTWYLTKFMRRIIQLIQVTENPIFSMKNLIKSHSIWS